MKLFLTAVLLSMSFITNASLITFDANDVTSYGSNQSKFGGFNILDSGNTLEVYGNNWVIIDLSTLPSLVNTTLTFDYMTESLGEVIGLGFDNDAKATNGGLYFQLGGTQTFGNQDYNSSLLNDTWYSVSIDLSAFDLSSYDRLVFIADQDAGGSTNSIFSNVTVEVPAPSALAVLGLAIALVSFTARRKN